MARPLTRKVNLKEGFYIEIRHSGDTSGIKIRRDTYEEIQIAIRQYEISHEVNYLGKLVNGKYIKTKAAAE